MSRFLTPSALSRDAYSRLKYRSLADFRREVFIWNSRDGLVPEQTVLPDGDVVRRCHSSADAASPGRICDPGEHVFVDLNLDDVPQCVDALATAIWERGEAQDYGDMAALRAYLMRSLSIEAERGGALVVQVPDEQAPDEQAPDQQTPDERAL